MGDDDIKIDISKIKNFFKRKPSKHETHHAESKVKSDVAGTDAPEKSKGPLVAKADDSVQIPIGKIKDSFSDVGAFLKAYATPILIILALLVPMGFSVHFRMYPDELPITDAWARDTVYSTIKSQITSNLYQKYPNLPDANIDALVEDEFQNALKAQKAQIEQQIKSTSQYFKSQFKDENDQTYLIGIDPELWYGEARNYVQYGHLGDKIVNGTSVYSLRDGRLDKEATPQLHPILIAYYYKFIHFFNSNYTLLRATYIMPVILITLSVIPAFFIARRFGGMVGGLFAGMIVAINGPLLGRTPAGFSDTDPYNILLPLLITWLFLEAFETENVKKQLILSALAGLITGFFSYAWASGWGYVFICILGSVVAYLVLLLITNFKNFKSNPLTFVIKGAARNPLINVITYMVFTGIFVTLFTGRYTFTSVFSKLFAFVKLREVAVDTLWPNVITTVAEFNTASVPNIISQMGGSPLFWIGTIGLILLLFNRKNPNLVNKVYLGISALYYLIMISLKDSLNDYRVFLLILVLPIIAGIVKIIMLREEKDIDIKLSLLLTLWFIATIYSFTKGIRFSILMVPAFAIAFGIAIGIGYRYISDLITKELHINLNISRGVVFLLLGLLLITPISQAKSIATTEIPNMTDAWYQSLIDIKEDTADGIITSWWDYGHWFVAHAQRRVTFDGGDQGERIHWVGKSLLTSEEKVNVGLLRMLNCGQEQAPHRIESFIDGDTIRAIDILNEIVVVDRDAAEKILRKNNLTDEQIASVIEVTHCEDLLDQYYITSEDMVGKGGVWAHFGSWDFRRAKMWQSVRGTSYNEGYAILQDQFNLSPAVSDAYYFEIQSTSADQWIAPWPSFRSGVGNCAVSGSKVQCGNGAIVNLTNYDAQVQTQQGAVTPASLVYVKNNDLVEKEFTDAQIEVSVLLIPNGNGYTSVLVDPQLADSMFVRLFFYDGVGLTHYTVLSDRTTITGERVIVWKVSFEEGSMILTDVVKAGSSVAVDYIGWLDDGSIFDSSIIGWESQNVSSGTLLESVETEPLRFTVGMEEVIPGFDQALLGMSAGDSKVVEIPPEKAYGTDTSHPLGNKTLHFRIKLVDVS
ncbi:MAG TPA: STT3 domain-containing protein [Candidatus Nanoarchaeia archaeon]|nr:STT3 domain-containing protein [Candidatus Nanoarchaeia archaeon]